MQGNSFCQRVIEAANARPDKIAMTLIEPGGAETTTFGEMLSQIRGVAYRLAQEQIAVGDRVALIGENHPRWAIAYLGILHRGAVVVPLDQAANVEALAHFIDDSEAKLAFVSPSSLEKFRAVCERLGRQLPVVTLRVTDREVVLSLLPLFHAYSQVVNLWVATIIGARVLYITELSSAEIERGLKEGGAPALVGAPRLWYLFHKKIFDAVGGQPLLVRRLFRAMLGLNGRLRDWLDINAGRFSSADHELMNSPAGRAVAAAIKQQSPEATIIHPQMNLELDLGLDSLARAECIVSVERASAGGLRAGKILNLYPEGQRSFGGRLQEFKHGAAILATELDLPVVPAAIDEMYRVWPRNSWRIRLARVRISFGEPFTPRSVIPDGMSGEAAYEAVANELKRRIQRMLDENEYGRR